jgi:hypothetical protein
LRLKTGLVRVERILLFITLLFAVLAAVIELSGIEANWLTRRLPAFTLLVLSSLVINVLLSGDRLNQSLAIQQDRLEKLERSTSSLVSREAIMSELDGIWASQAPTIHAFLDRMTGYDKRSPDSLARLVTDLSKATESLSKGSLEGRGQRYAWDATIVGIDLATQIFVYHPSSILVGRSAIPRFSANYADILLSSKDVGELIVATRRTSEQMLAVIGDEGWSAPRFSKVYFRKLYKLNVVVIFEAHLSIVHQLPIGSFKTHSV